jgi:hypothetical protein
VSLNKFTEVFDSLRSESQKHHWVFSNLKADELPNPTISHGVRISAPSLSWDIFYDDVRNCVLLQTGAVYEFTRQEPLQIARSIVQDIAYLIAGREELH